MKDFIPIGTGNSRFLRSNIPANITLAELVNLLRSGQFPIDLAGVNAGGVAQQGTPLNKSSLLSDDTAAALGLSGDPTPNDALNTIAAELPKRLIATFTASGTFNIADYGLKIGDKIDAYLVGGGGGGGNTAVAYSGGGGGGGGYTRLITDFVLQSATHAITIGAGGAVGSAGGNTIAFGVTVIGGKNGTAAVSSAQAGAGGNGGSGGGAGGSASSVGYPAGMGGMFGGDGERNRAPQGATLVNGGVGDRGNFAINPYNPLPYGSGGGGGAAMGAAMGGTGAGSGAQINAVASAAVLYGCGGGGAAYSNNVHAASAGFAGVVFIYA